MHTADSRSLLTRALYTCRPEFLLEESIGCRSELSFGPSRKLKCRIAGKVNEPLGLNLGRAEGGVPCDDHHGVFRAKTTEDLGPCLNEYLLNVDIKSFESYSTKVESHVIRIARIQGASNALSRKITMCALVPNFYSTAYI